MTMAFNSGELRKTGNSADAHIADMLDMRIAAYGDFPLPAAELSNSGTKDEDAERHVSIASTDSALAHVALATPDLLPDISRNVEYDIQIERLAKLRNELIEIAQPLYVSTNNALPLAKDSPRTMFGNLKKKDAVEWEIDLRKNNHQVYYSFEVAYHPSNTVNVADNLKLTASLSPEKNNQDMHFKYTFDNAAIKEIILKDQQSHGKMSRNLTSHLENTFASDSTSEWDVHPLGGKEIYRMFSSDTTHTLNFYDNTVSFTSGSNIATIYRTYDPADDTFKTTLHDNNGKITHGRDISPNVIKTLVFDLVHAAPMRQLDI